MMKNKKSVWRACLPYKYAPESCFINELQRDGKYKKADVSLTGSMCGYYLASGNEEKATAEVKHIMRKNRNRKHKLVAFGFYLKGSSCDYVYCRDISMFSNQYNMVSKLNHYKEFKQYCIENNCKCEISATAKLDGGYNIKSVVKEYAEVDLSRPIKIYINLI